MRRPHWLWMIPVLLLVTWCGARSLNVAPLWGDELNTMRDARGSDGPDRSPVEVWNGVGSRNPVHVPGYFIVLSLWSSAAGWSEPAVRALSLLLGVAAVALTYRLGRDLIGHRGGVYAAAILSTSMLYVHYLYHARMYIMSVFFTVLALWLYLRIVRMKGEPRLIWWLGLLISAVGLLYTHYIAALVLIPMGLYHVLFVRRNRRWGQVAAVVILAGILFLPWLNLFRAGVAVVEDQETLHGGALMASQVVIWIGTLFGGGQGILTLMLLGLSAYAALRDRNPRRATAERRIWLLALVLLATILIVNAALEIISDKRARYLLGLWPLLSLLGAIGFLQLDRWLPRLGTLLLAAWLVFGVVQSNSVLLNNALDGYNAIYPLHTAAGLVISRAQPGDVLINDVPDNRPEPKDFNAAADYYFAATPLKNIVSRGADTFADNQAALAASPRLWLAYETDRKPSNLTTLRQSLAALFQHCSDLNGANNLKVELYVRLSDACPA